MFTLPVGGVKEIVLEPEPLEPSLESRSAVATVWLVFVVRFFKVTPVTMVTSPTFAVVTAVTSKV